MESDRALDSTIEALGDLSTNELDEMLQLDTFMPTQDSDTLAINREELSSQFSSDFDTASNRNLSAFLTTLDETLTNPFDSSSVIIATEDIELIDINDSTEAIASSVRIEDSLCISNDPCQSLKQSSCNTVRQTPLETTFDKEFAQFDDSDFELPELDDESQWERQKNEFIKKGEDKFKSNTQMLPLKIDVSNHGNVSNSCPKFTKEFYESTQSSQKSIDRKNAFDYLETSCSTTSSSQPKRECLMDISDILESSISTDSKKGETDQDEIVPTTNRNENDNSTTDASGIPITVKQLYDLMKARFSDFCFVYAISAQLCQEQVPMGCFVNVKMALLLSLASIGKNPAAAPIPIIVMSNDPYIANYLITTIADLAGRFVGPVDETKPPSSDGYRDHNWIEADPIQLAKGGVFYVGEWICMSAKRSEKIFKDIETSRVAVERTRRIFPLQTAIWAHWHALKYKSKDQQIFNKFIKVFGVPIFMDNKNNEALFDYILKQASVELFESTIDHLTISPDDMRKFLAVISDRTVDFTDEAITILQKYFIASRTERPDCLTKQAFTVLKQFAESFAKLSLRHEVLTIDAIGAIFLCEHFIQNLFGVGANPPPVIESNSFVGYIDSYIGEFHEWVQNYIEKYNETKELQFKYS